MKKPEVTILITVLACILCACSTGDDPTEALVLYSDDETGLTAVIGGSVIASVNQNSRSSILHCNIQRYSLHGFCPSENSLSQV